MGARSLFTGSTIDNVVLAVSYALNDPLRAVCASLVIYRVWRCPEIHSVHERKERLDLCVAPCLSCVFHQSVYPVHSCQPESHHRILIDADSPASSTAAASLL